MPSGFENTAAGAASKPTQNRRMCPSQRRGRGALSRTCILIMTDLFFATYGELVLLTKAWKMHDALITVVVHILIELASYSNSAW